MTSPAQVPIKVIVGMAMIGDSSVDRFAKFDTPEEVQSLLDLCYERGYRELDTARVYSPLAPGSSEPRLGAARAGDRFVIDTKVWSNEAGSHSIERIAASVQEQLEALKVDKVHIDYLHMPERSVSLAEALEGMDRQYRAGKFEKLGISNYTPDEVRELLAISKEKGFVKPSVYQGNYNAITRGVEKELFPLLRENGIAFYAYSPTAGGFFNPKEKRDRSGGRFNNSDPIAAMYSSLYTRPQLTAAADQVIELTAKHGINAHAAALRWVVYHSALSAQHGDGVIFGASSEKQMTQNFDAVEAGPLPKDLADLLSSIFELDEAEKKGFYM